MKKTLLIIILIMTAILLVGCASKTISEIKTQDYVGKKVTISGTVKNTIKIGPISAYTLEDKTGQIGVATQKLPNEGKQVTVTGVLIKDTLFGYYIKLDE